MDFDFKKEYEKLSNTELLAILEHAGRYQPDAVIAAKEVLETRSISQEEEETLARDLRKTQAQAHYKKVLNTRIRNTIQDKLQYLLTPSQNLTEVQNISRWITVLVGFLIIRYLFNLPHLILSVKDFFTYSEDYLNIDLLLIILGIIYMPWICYLLVKRRRWGWIIFLANCMFMAVSRTLSSILFYIFQSYTYKILFRNADLDWVNALFIIFLNSTLVYYMLKPSVLDYFDISTPIKKRTIIISATIITLFFLVVFINIAI